MEVKEVAKIVLKLEVSYVAGTDKVLVFTPRPYIDNQVSFEFCLTCILSFKRSSHQKRFPLLFSLFPPGILLCRRRLKPELNLEASALNLEASATIKSAIEIEIRTTKFRQSAKPVKATFEDLQPCNMKEDGLLCPPSNQVGGHCAEGGNLGPLVDKAGRFYKPLQDNQRGKNEVEFYEKFWADQRIPPNVQDLFPRFYGTKFVQASDGSGMCEHVVMEDITYHFHHPSVIDIKMGSRTWYPGATEEYIKKCLNKDRETTSALLGFRISGMQVYDTTTKTTWKADKKWCKVLNAEGARLALKRFVSTNPFSETDSDGSLASLIYSGPECVLSQLLELKAWFEQQTYFHFSSASLLLIYEGDSTSITENAHRSGISVKLVDFAHVIDGQNIIDHNFLGGLCSLINVLSQIMVVLGMNIPEGSLSST